MSEFEGCKLYYFEPLLGHPTYGRAEPIRLLLEDAGLKYEYIRIAFKDWPKTKENLIDNGSRAPTLPYITTKNGKLYNTMVASMRAIAKTLGSEKKYYPEDAEDQYLADVYCDLSLDWMNKLLSVKLFGQDEAAKKDYMDQYAPKQLANWNNILNDKNGPYLLGDEISYSDFFLYNMLENEGFVDNLDAEKYPHLVTFIETFKNRPNLKKYLAA
ncbi:glutathione S-transferase [Cokeromyces recurvatus]|uniref:glutathione S-transferase n=1 Tax=Cokeromyces recurvatus TaxID=90255 RepID=UPI00221F5B8F|nr:glutathione S-transferase [Cokeromyces recurvatus]KAI7901443.1 glutathione S-transferase [Cokeromyces recurvatus]